MCWQRDPVYIRHPEQRNPCLTVGRASPERALGCDVGCAPHPGASCPAPGSGVGSWELPSPQGCGVLCITSPPQTPPYITCRAQSLSCQPQNS